MQQSALIKTEEERNKTGKLEKAIEKQTIYGGRVDSILFKNEAFSDAEKKAYFKFYPKSPKHIADTGLSQNFLVDLVLKHALVEKNFTLSTLSNSVKLGQSILAKCIDILRNDRLVEIRSTNNTFSMVNTEYRITEAGISRAAYLLEENRYVGPAPVPLKEYSNSVQLQTVRTLDLDYERMRKAFSSIVISEKKYKTLGAAVNSGRPIFIYGPSGNGKSTIANAIGNSIPGEIFIPYAILAGGQIIVLYDDINHKMIDMDAKENQHDARWVKIERPVVFTGGELTLKSLDLEFNQTTKYYEAPLQVKANNGVFVVDDFGRQLIDPQILLNRWIVPLERRADFLTLSTGLKFEIPFDQIVIFATNISPKDLADEAFLRRLRYKILIDSPKRNEFQTIFKSICEYHKMAYNNDAFNRLLMHYKKSGIRPIACHPRDLIDHVIDAAHFEGKPPEITPESIDMAWENYFFEHKLD